MSRTFYPPAIARPIPPRVVFTSDSTDFSFLQQPKRGSSGASTTPSNDIAVFIDGSCVNRGTRNAKAGMGVYFAPNSNHNISQRLRGGMQTGQRAEVCAAALALEKVDELVQNGLLQTGKVVLLSDSNHVVYGITSYMEKWKKNEWKSGSGQPVEKDDFEKLDEQIEHLAGCGILVQFWHVSRFYNKEADRLAREAVTRP